MTRLGPLNPETMDEALRKEYDSLVRNRGVPEGGVFGGPFDAWIRSPELCHKMREFGGMLWERTSLDRGIVELAISVTAAYWNANVEWSHAETAVRNGIDRSVLDQVQAGQRPTSPREDVGLVYDLTMAFLRNKSLSEALYQKAIAVFGERGLVEVAEVVGFYTMVSFTTRAFDIEPPEGRPAPFSRPPDA
jgi:4-carboxymuconolactone decarboxylase